MVTEKQFGLGCSRARRPSSGLIHIPHLAARTEQPRRAARSSPSHVCLTTWRSSRVSKGEDLWGKLDSCSLCGDPLQCRAYGSVGCPCSRCGRNGKIKPSLENLSRLPMRLHGFPTLTNCHNLFVEAVEQYPWEWIRPPGSKTIWASRISVYQCLGLCIAYQH